MKTAARDNVERQGEEREGLMDFYRDKTEIPSLAACGTSDEDVHVNVLALTHTNTYLCTVVRQRRFEKVQVTGLFLVPYCPSAIH